MFTKKFGILGGLYTSGTMKIHFFLMDDDFYKYNEDDISLESAEFLMDNYRDPENAILTETQTFELIELIGDYLNEIYNSQEYVSLKPIHKWAKRHIARENWSENCGFPRFKRVDYNHIFLQFIPHLIDNLVNPYNFKQSEISENLFHAFAYHPEIFKELTLYEDLMIAFLGKVLEFPFQYRLFLPFFIDFVDFNKSDVFWMKRDFSDYLKLIQKEANPLIYDNSLKILYSISKYFSSSDFQQAFLEFIDKNPILPDKTCARALAILSNFVQSNEFNNELFIDFFQNHQEYPYENFFIANMMDHPNFHTDILEKRLIPYFSRFFLLLIKKNFDFLQYIPIDIVYSYCQSMIQNGEQHIQEVLIGVQTYVFELLGYIATKSPIDQNMIDISKKVFEGIKKFSINESFIVKEKLLISTAFVFPLIFPEHVSIGDLDFVLSYMSEFLISTSDLYCNLICEFMLKIKSIILKKGNDEILHNFMENEIIHILNDIIYSEDCENTEIIEEYQKEFPPPEIT